MPCSFPYPTAFPLDCVQEAVAILRGGSLSASLKEFAHSAWTIQGYLQASLLGTPSPVVGVAPAGDEHRALLCELKDELGKLGAAPAAANPLSLQLVALVRDYLLPLLAMWLSKLAGSN